MPPEYVFATRSAASSRSNWTRSSSARRRASALGSWYSRPNIQRFSRPVRFSSTAAYCPERPITLRTACASLHDVEIADAGAPGVRLEERGEDPHGRRLAGPVRAEQPEDGPLGHLEIDAVERPHLGLPRAVDLDEPLCLDRSHGAQARRSPFGAGVRFAVRPEVRGRATPLCSLVACERSSTGGRWRRSRAGTSRSTSRRVRCPRCCRSSCSSST